MFTVDQSSVSSPPPRALATLPLPPTPGLVVARGPWAAPVAARLASSDNDAPEWQLFKGARAARLASFPFGPRGGGSGQAAQPAHKADFPLKAKIPFKVKIPPKAKIPLGPKGRRKRAPPALGGS